MSAATVINRVNSLLRKANYTISAILVAIFFFVLFVHLNRQVRDLDLWLHLKTGEQIFTTHKIALIDPYSFTKSGAAWINHEWLFQLLSYLSYKYLGFDGLIILQNIVFLVVFLILFAMGAKNRRFMFTSTMLFILLLNSSYRFTIRPDMFSVLFLVIFIYVLREKNKFLYILYILPLIQILWSNIHGFFFMGPLVILVFALTEKDKKLWVILVLSLLASILNPQLLKGALYPLTTLVGLANDRSIFGFIQELKPPLTWQTLLDVQSRLFYKSLIIVSLFSFRFNQKRFNLTLFILWLVFFLFSLTAIRNIIYFAVVAIMVIFYNANERFSYDKNLSNERVVNKNYYYLARYSLIFVFSLCLAKNAAMNMNCHYYDFDKYAFSQCMWGISTRDFPAKAVDFIIKENLPQRLFNDFNSGSYLIGRTFPPRKVFIDGRTEFYGNEFLKTYREATKGNEDKIQEIIAKYDLQGFLLAISEANFDQELAKYLLASPDWKVVYFDENSILFLKDTTDNRNIVQRFNINLKDWVAPKADLEKIGPRIIYPRSYIFRGETLKEIGCFDSALSEAREALKIMPNSVEAFKLFGDCYLKLKDYQNASKNYRLALKISPKSAELLNSYALALYKLGNLSQAEVQLLKAIKQRPKDAVNYHALAMLYRKQNRLEKAKEMAKKSCEYSGNRNYDYIKLYADTLCDLKDYGEALKIYKLAARLDPKNYQLKETIEKIEKTL